MTSKHMKKCSTSLIIPGEGNSLILREMHIKTTMRYHFTLIRVPVIKKIYNKCQRCREKGTLLHLVGI